ncbi:Uncharacterised protein [Yersinia enterocolitica]|nr:Uncharacterised protein [Yersinia enterocolitica]
MRLSWVLACSNRLVISTSVSPVSRSCCPEISLICKSSGKRKSGKSGNSGLANSSFKVSPRGVSAGAGAAACCSTASLTAIAVSTAGFAASGTIAGTVFGNAINNPLILVGIKFNVRCCQCAPVRNSFSEIAVSSIVTLTLFSDSKRKVMGYGVLNSPIGSVLAGAGAVGSIALVSTTTSTSCAVSALTHSSLRFRHDSCNDR